MGEMGETTIFSELEQEILSIPGFFSPSLGLNMAKEPEIVGDSVPATPETPETPETPAAPQTPGTPATPETPEATPEATPDNDLTELAYIAADCDFTVNLTSKALFDLGWK